MGCSLSVSLVFNPKESMSKLVKRMQRRCEEVIKNGEYEQRTKY